MTRDDSPYSRERAERVFLLATIVLLGWLTFQLFRPFLDWVILGFLFAYLFRKPYLGALTLFRKRSLAAGFMLIVTLLIFFLPFVVIIAMLLRDVASIGSTLRELDIQLIISDILHTLSGTFGIGTDSGTIQNVAGTIAASIREATANVFGSVASTLFAVVAKIFIGLFIFGFTVYYGFVDGDRFVNGVLGVIPLHRLEKAQLVAEFKTVTDAIFVGHVLVSLIQATIGTLGFMFLGVPRGILWGFVMLVMALVPVIGPVIVWVPIGVILLITDGDVNGVLSSDRNFAALGVLLVVGPIVSTVDNIVRPKLVGSRADVHPFLVLIGVLGGLAAFGFTGFLIGPLILALFLAMLRVYREHWSGEAALVHDGPTKAGLSGKLKKRGSKSDG